MTPRSVNINHDQSFAHILGTTVNSTSN